MDWSFEMVDPPGFIKVVTSGDFCSVQFGRMMDELIALDYRRPGTPLLVDHRKLRVAEADSMEILKAAKIFLNRAANFTFAPAAILYDTPEAMEVAERYGEITDDQSRAEVQRFLNPSDAVNWLTSYLATA